MPIQINNVPRRVVYAASGTGPYAFTFEILAAGDIAVYRDDTLLTITTDYTVTIASNGTGSITLTAAPTGATQIAIVGNRTIQRTTDFTTGGDFFANTVNDELDQQTIFAQQNAEGLSRALQAPQTDPTTINMILPRASTRANKTLAFDADGNPTTGEIVGNWRGNWASGTAYAKRDLIKDTSNANVYICVTAHTSSGSQPISTNADSAKWALMVDAASANAAQVAAEAAQAAAETAETNAETAETNAETAATNAASSASAAATSASNASTSATNAASSASTASTQATNASNSATAAAASASTASTAATNASNSASSASTSASNASTSATNAASSASAASTSATNAANSASAASTSATNASNSATAAAASETAAAASATAAAASYDSFDDRYLGAKTVNPTVDNDGNALLTGAIYFNSVANEMRVYTGSAWQALPTLPDLVVEYEFTATAGQTSYTFSGGYRVGFVYVWVNGVMLSDADITATDGSTITFGTALSLNDEVRVMTFKAVGSITATDVGALPLTGGTVTGNTVVSVNSSDTALRITQTGAGNALVVEDSTNPDSSPFLIDNLGKVSVGSLSQYTIGSITPYNQWNNTDNQYASIALASWQAGTGTCAKFVFARGDSGTVGDFSNAVDSGDVLGSTHWFGSDGTAFVEAAKIDAQVDGTPGTNDMPGRLVFSTTADGASTPTERMRIDSAGRVGIGTSPFGSTQLVLSGAAGFDAAQTTVYAARANTTMPSTGTSSQDGFGTTLVGNAASHTVTGVQHFHARSYTIGASQTVTNQYGFYANSALTGATNNYGFYSNIASGSGRWNFYANGTAANYFGGDVQFEKAIIEKVFTITDGAAFEIDPSNGTIQLITLGANRTPKATNFAAGESVTLMVDDGTARTLTWTDSTFGGSGVVWKTNAGVAPTLNTTGYTVITLWKVGTQVYGARVGDA